MWHGQEFCRASDIDTFKYYLASVSHNAYSACLFLLFLLLLLHLFLLLLLLLLLHSLNPDKDPLCVLLLIDYYAVRSYEYEFLINLFSAWEVSFMQRE